ncbi:MAG: DNA-binding response regulator [Chloroflexi bacterium]|nr:MAG: DNA-binding response regulator [Chloroflexota bacterium]
MIRILVADDHPIVRDGLVAVLSTQAEFAVIGTAGDGEEVLRQVRTHTPDVLLLDLEMPRLDGVETLRRLAGEEQPVRTIVFTAFDTDDRIVEAIRAGAQGYLLKGAPREELFNAIRVVHAGGTLLHPVVATKLLGRLRQQDGPDALTPREEEVLQLVAQGLPNKEIAARLVITERTVKFHVSSILGKLGASNRTEMVALAKQRGLIKL